MNFNFGEVLSRAWQIVWKHKVLWIFGILAGCGRGGGGGNGGGGGTRVEGQPQNLPPEVMQWIQSIEQNLMVILAIGIAVICVIWIVVVFLSTIGRIGLIHGASLAERGAESLNFGQLFSESLPYFWRMFVLSLIVTIPILLIFAALFAGVVVLALSASTGDVTAGLSLLGIVPLLVCGMCILIPVLLVVGVIVRQAESAIVLEDLSVLPALSRGWEVCRNNPGPVILIALIIMVIGAAVGFVIALPLFFAVIPAALAVATGNTQNVSLVFTAICVCLYLPILLVLNGIMTSYVESVWTLTYMRLTKPQDQAPVVLEANA